MTKVKKITILLLLLFFFGYPIYGKTIAAKSGSRNDIQSAVDLAQDGDTVVIPAGTFSFDGTVTITDKSIHIKGAGRDSTLLNKVGTGTAKNNMFRVYMHEKKGITFSDLKLCDVAGPYSVGNSAEYTVGIRLDYGVWGFKIYNMEFEGFAFAGICCKEYGGTDPSIKWWKQMGVIWNCRFLNCFMPGLGYSVGVYGGSYIDGPEKNWAASESADLGGEYFVFIEDCYFSGSRHAVSGGYGGRYVARYNTVKINSRYETSFDAHDYIPEQNQRGTRAWEIYKNTIVLPSGSNSDIGIHGGEGVIWGNTASGGNPSGVYMIFATPNEKVPPEQSYPAPDQIRNAYVWDNMLNGKTWVPTVWPLAGGTEIIQEGRDYFLFKPAGYHPYPYPHPLRSDAPLSVAATATPQSGLAPLTVEFTGSASGGTPPYSYNWSFGDGASSPALNPAHTYSAPGLYEAKFRALDSDDNEGVTSFKITVSSVAATKHIFLSAATGEPAQGEGGTTDPPPGDYSHPQGAIALIQAVPSAEYRFSGWSGDVSAGEAFDRQIEVKMDQDKSIAAHFCTPCADVNGDLKVTASDSQAAFDIFLGTISNPTDCQLENSDVNRDGAVTPADALAIFSTYLMKGESIEDCSGKPAVGAAAVLPTTEIAGLESSVEIESAGIEPGEYAFFSIIFNQPLDLHAFGMDIRFPDQFLEYVRWEPTELSRDFEQIGFHLIGENTLRIGGYNQASVMSRSPALFAILVFKHRTETAGQISCEIAGVYDDLKEPAAGLGIMDQKTGKETKTVRPKRSEKVIK